MQGGKKGKYYITIHCRL